MESMSYNPYSLEGKTIFVTGASSGIGRATAIECSKLGAKVIITARNKVRLEETLNAMTGKGHELRICDFGNEQELKEMIATLPSIDGLVNNAGFTKAKPIPFIKEDDIHSLLDINTVAPIMIVKFLLKQKKINNGGSIVFTSSIAGIGYTVVGNAMYSSTKGAISAFVPCAALELAQKGIRVNAICPGMVETNILSSGDITNEQVELDKQNYLWKRYGKPVEIAWAISYLLSDASQWVTGTNMIIDGGYSIR